MGRSKSAQPFGLRRQTAVSSVAPPRRTPGSTPSSSLLGSDGLALATRFTRDFDAGSNVRSDEDLLLQAQRGDQKAFAEFYERYWRKVLNYVYRFTGNRATAEELTQETFLRVVRNIRNYRPTGSAGGWVYQIARNLGLNAIRDSKAAREFSLDEPIALEEDEVNRQEITPGRGPKPDEEAVRREREEAIQQGLLKIAPHHREVLILCDIESRSYQEVARMLQIPINTVASRLSRARAQMAQFLGYLKEGK